MATKPEKIKKKTPVWRHWPAHKILYAVHWTILIWLPWTWWRGRLPFIESGEISPLVVALFTIGGTIGSYFFWASLLDGSTLATRIFGFLFFPAKCFVMPISFTWESIRTYRKNRNRIPYRSGFILCLGISLSIALLDHHKFRLMLAEPFLWLLLVVTLSACLKWTLNPISCYVKNLVKK